MGRATEYQPRLVCDGPLTATCRRAGRLWQRAGLHIDRGVYGCHGQCGPGHHHRHRPEGDQSKGVPTTGAVRPLLSQACLDQGKYATNVAQQDLEDGTVAGVQGTPGFILGKTQPDGSIQGIAIKGAQPLAGLPAGHRTFAGGERVGGLTHSWKGGEVGWKSSCSVPVVCRCSSDWWP